MTSQEFRYYFPNPVIKQMVLQKYSEPVTQILTKASKQTFVHFGRLFLARKASPDFMAWILSSFEASLPIQTKIPDVVPVYRIKQSC
jgi:hypothetical protein